MRHVLAPVRETGFLRYECVESSIGRLLVVMSEQGVVDVILGDSRAQLLSSAVRRFPNTGFIPDRAAHAEWVASIVRHIELPYASRVVPVDLGSRRQTRVAS